MTKIILVLMISTLLSACGTTGKKQELAKSVEPENSVSQEAHMVANENEAPFVTELVFKKGSQALSKVSKKKLQTTLVSAQKSGEIEEIKIVTWADQEYPSVHAKTLPESQVNLVKRRNEEIKKYLQAFDKETIINEYSMAERPSSIGTMFDTSNARIKKSLEVAGIPNSDTAVKQPSKAQKSIVMIILK